MKIAVVSPYDVSYPGGVQTQAIELVSRLRAAGDEAWLVAPGAVDGVPVRSVGGSLVIRGNRSNVPLALSPRVIKRVRAAVDDADVCHIHEPFAPLVSVAALRAGRPFIATFHAAPPGWVETVYRMAGGIGKRLLDGVGGLTAVSPVAAASLDARWGAPRIVPNGLDVASFQLSGQRNPHRVVFVGRDEPRKGLDVLLKSWGEVMARISDAELWIIGLERPQRSPGVRFLGRLDEASKRAALAGSSVLVAPNLGGESFGIVLTEGMAAGCAVVASDLPAFRWVLGDDRQLVPPGDAVALSSALIEILEDGDLRERWAAAGTSRVEAFDWSRVVSEYRHLYAVATG